MLASHDRHLAGRDAVLPGLELLFDADAFRERLNQSLPDEILGPLRVAYVRYKPRTSCIVGFAPLCARQPLRCYATAYPRDSTKLAKARKRVNTAGHVLWEDSAVHVCVFPTDTRLPQLVRVLDDEQRDSMLQRRFPMASPHLGAEPHVLAYKPERRAVVKLQGRNGKHAVMRMYARREYAVAQRSARIVRSSRLPFAAVIRNSDTKGIVLTGWCEGRDLWDCICYGRAGSLKGEIHAAGAALARMHLTDASRIALPTLSADLLKRELNARASSLVDLVPELASDARRAATMVAGMLYKTQWRPALLHGDFNPRQIVVNTAEVRFIDFDEIVRGPRAYDVGVLAAFLELQALKGMIAIEDAHAVRDAFLRGYTSVAPAPAHHDVAVHTLAALMRRAHDPFREGRPHWPDEIAHIVGRVLEAAAA